MSEGKRNYNKLQLIIYLVIIPILSITLLAALYFIFFANDLREQLREATEDMPVISSITSDRNESIAEEDPVELLQHELDDAYTIIDEQADQIEQLEAAVAEKETELDQLGMQLQETVEELQQVQDTHAEYDMNLRQVTAIFGEMSARRAADIMADLSLEDTVAILQELNERDQANILGRMDSDEAAQITRFLKATDEHERQTVLSDATDVADTVSLEDAVNTVSQLPPDMAAQILTEMRRATVHEQQFSRAILYEMAEGPRSAIMSEMETDVARQFLNDLQ